MRSNAFWTHNACQGALLLISRPGLRQDQRDAPETVFIGF